MLRVNAINRQGLLKCLTFNPKSLVFKTVSVPMIQKEQKEQTETLWFSCSCCFVAAGFLGCFLGGLLPWLAGGQLVGLYVLVLLGAILEYGQMGWLQGVALVRAPVGSGRCVMGGLQALHGLAGVLVVLGITLAG